MQLEESEPYLDRISEKAFSTSWLERDTDLRNIYSYGCIPADRAFVFTNPAADAEFPSHMGEFQNHVFTIRTHHAGFFQQDGLFRHWTHLLANKTGLMIRPGDAPVFIDVCQSDHLTAFCFQIKRWNRLNGADLPTGIAGIIAIAKPRDEDGRTQTCCTHLQDRWLQSSGWANADTVVAAGTFRECHHI